MGKAARGQQQSLTSLRASVMRGRHWFTPEYDPISTGEDTDPEAWYLDQLWKIVFLPFHQ